MTLTDVANDLSARNVVYLYDERGGHYLLMMLVNKQFVPVHPLSRDEALTFVCKRDQVLRHVYPRKTGWTYKQNIARMQRRHSGIECSTLKHVC